MPSTKKIIIIASLVSSALIIGGSLLAAGSRSNENIAAGRSHTTPVPQRPVTTTELAAATGKNGTACLVAVDAIVYEIKEFSLWQDGKHVPSNGEAYCGADLSTVIDKAPHGRRILDLLIKIGPLAQ
jgi:predicted heme/steroid binding protein